MYSNKKRPHSIHEGRGEGDKTWKSIKMEVIKSRFKLICLAKMWLWSNHMVVAWPNEEMQLLIRSRYKSKFSWFLGKKELSLWMFGRIGNWFNKEKYTWNLECSICLKMSRVKFFTFVKLQLVPLLKSKSLGLVEILY